MRRFAIAVGALGLVALLVWAILPGAEKAPRAEEPSVTPAKAPVETVVPPLEGSGRNTAREAAPPAEKAEAPQSGTRATDGADLTGRVLLEGSDAPVAGARVIVMLARWKADEVDVEVLTGDGGEFRASPLPAGVPLRVVVLAPDCVPWGYEFPKEANRRDIIVHVEKGGILEGTVRDEKGQPLAAAKVKVTGEREPLPPRRLPHQWFIGDYEERSAEAVLRSAETDDKGHFIVRGVRLGSPLVAVVTTSERFEARSEPATFTVAGERLTRDLSIPVSGSLRAVFQGPAVEGDGQWQMTMKGSTIWFDEQWKGWPEGGSHVLAGVPPGAFHLLTWWPGHPIDDRRVEVRAGEEVVVNFAEATGQALRGIIVDAKGQPVPGATVWWTARNDSTLTRSSSDGRFAFAGLAGRRGELTVDVLGVLQDRHLARTVVRDVEPGSSELRVVLHEAPRIKGRIAGSEAGRNLLQRSMSRSSSSSGPLVLQEGGAFELETDQVGEPLLLVLGTEAPIVVEVPALAGGATHDVGTLTEMRSLTLSVLVRDEKGEPIVGAKVIPGDRWIDEEAETATDAAGIAKILQLPQRPIWIRIDAPGHPVHVFTLTPRASAEPQLLRVGMGGLLDLEIADEQGAPVAKPYISISPAEEDPYDADRDRLRRSRELDDQGHGQLRLEARRHRIRAFDSEGRKTASADVEITEGQTAKLRLTVK